MRAAALALVVALALLGLPARLAHAKDCRGETPLPADRAVVAAAPGLPADIAAFLGGWRGTWTRVVAEWTCTVLVVQEVYANGYARGVYSVGKPDEPGDWPPMFVRVTGRIVQGTLRLRLPGELSADLAFRLDADRLHGALNGDRADVILTRVPDLAALECGAAYRTPVAVPGAVRDRLTADRPRCSAAPCPSWRPHGAAVHGRRDASWL